MRQSLANPRMWEICFQKFANKSHFVLKVYRYEYR